MLYIWTVGGISDSIQSSHEARTEYLRGRMMQSWSFSYDQDGRIRLDLCLEGDKVPS